MKLLKNPTVFINVFLPAILAVALLYAYQKNIRPADDIGLGRGTSTDTPYVNNYPIHIFNTSMADSLKKGWELRGKKELNLWFGNSQLHGVNQYKQGQENCILFCYNLLAASGKTVLGISYPNANMQEFLVSVLFFTHQFPAVKTIIIPAFYDDMREDGIRNTISSDAVKLFLREANVKKYFANVPSIVSLTSSAGSLPEKGAGDMTALNKTAQETSEKYLEHCLLSWPIWASRPDIRGNIFNDIYYLRNTVLGIQANSVRKMIPGRYQDNYNALKDILQYGRDRKIPVLVYIPPLRNDVSPPYNVNEYNSYKKSVEKDANLNGAFFINLENLVPAKWWGIKASTSFDRSEEIDFMHFQQEGHRLIADTIYKTLKKINGGF